MLYFIAYDISQDKIRNQVAKFLEKNACQRIQFSVFLGKLNPDKKLYVWQTLKELLRQSTTEDDNILMMPFEKDQLRQVEILGKNKKFEEFTEPPNTYFF